MKLSDKNFAEIIAKSAVKDEDRQALARALWAELNASKKVKDLDRICELAEEIVAANENALNAKVASAVELLPEQIGEIKDYLSKKFNKEIIIKKAIDITLGAGIAVEIDGNIYDISLKSKIQRLKKAINN